MELTKREYGVSKPAILRSQSAFGEGTGSILAPIPTYPCASQSFISDASLYRLETTAPSLSGVSLVRRPRERSKSSRPSSSRSRSRCLPSKDRKTGRKSRNPNGKDSSGSLTRPLSAIAADLPHCHVSNATAFATRTTEQRKEESNRSGKIKRPLNAFMLYRRMYQNVAKAHCSRNNHQQVSAICGLSWNIEPEQVKQAFRDLADIERRYHGEAFPAYKYDPQNSKKGDDKSLRPSLPTPDVSDVEFVNGHGSVRGGMTKRNRMTTPKYDGVSHSGNEGHPYTVDELEFVQPRGNRSYRRWTPPSSQAYPAVYLEEQHTEVDPVPFQSYPPPSDDNRLACRNLPPVVCGLYGDAADDGLGYAEIFVDPSLLPCQPSMVYDISSYSVAFQGQWHTLPLEISRTEAMLSEMSMSASSYDAYLRGAEGDWEVEELEEPSQFEDWMCQTGA